MQLDNNACVAEREREREIERERERGGDTLTCPRWHRTSYRDRLIGRLWYVLISMNGGLAAWAVGLAVATGDGRWGK